MNVFISLQLDQKQCRNSASRNFVEKKPCKQRGFFNHQNYIKKSKWKQRGFFDQRNYIKKCAWKQRGFFDHQNYFKKSTLSTKYDFSISEITSKKYVEMIWKFVEVWSSTFRRNIHVESMSIWLSVPVGVVLCIIWSKCKNEDKKFFKKKN